MSFVRSFSSMRNHCLIFCFVLLTFVTNAQSPIGNRFVFDYLTLPQSARSTALGGKLIALDESDPALVMENPAVLNQDMVGWFTLSSSYHIASSSYGHMMYIFGKPESIGTYAVALQHTQYGLTRQFAPNQRAGGLLYPFESAATFSMSVPYGRYKLGGNLKFTYASLIEAQSIGLSADFVGMYTNDEKQITVTLAAKNVGHQILPYTSEIYEPLPFDLQFGFSKRLKHLPLRFMFHGHNLTRWNIKYSDLDEANDDLFSSDEPSASGSDEGFTADEFFRHITFGAEIYFGKKFRVDVGYNHMRRAELLLSGQNARRGLTGFTGGFGITGSKYQFQYGYARYHLAASSHNFTLNIDIHQLQKQKQLRKVVL